MLHLKEQNGIKNVNQNSLAIYGDKTSKRCEELLIKIDEVKEKMVEFGWPLKSSDKFLREYIA